MKEDLGIMRRGHEITVYVIFYLLLLFFFFIIFSNISPSIIYDMEDNQKTISHTTFSFRHYSLIIETFDTVYVYIDVYIIHIFYSSKKLTFVNSETFINVQKLLMIVRLFRR